MTQVPLEAFPDVPVKETMSEKELMRGVIDVLKLFGYRVGHFRSVPVRRGSRVVWETPVQADGKGFPDLVAVRERVVWIELKVGANTLSASQADWINDLRNAGQEVYVFTDVDWERGIVEAKLR